MQAHLQAILQCAQRFSACPELRGTSPIKLKHQQSHSGTCAPAGDPPVCAAFLCLLKTQAPAVTLRSVMKHSVMKHRVVKHGVVKHGVMKQSVMKHGVMKQHVRTCSRSSSVRSVSLPA